MTYVVVLVPGLQFFLQNAEGRGVHEAPQRVGHVRNLEQGLGQGRARYLYLSWQFRR